MNIFVVQKQNYVINVENIFKLKSIIWLKKIRGMDLPNYNFWSQKFSLAKRFY